MGWLGVWKMKMEIGLGGFDLGMIWDKVLREIGLDERRWVESDKVEREWDWD